MGRELELRHRFYEVLFQDVIVEPSARKEVVRLIVEEEIELEDVRITGGRMWNDNVIWAKGDCLQRDDEEPIELLHRTLKKSHQSKVKKKKKKSLLDIIAQEGVELKVMLKDLGININKRANSRPEKVQKSQTMRLMTDMPDSTTSSKLAPAFPKKKMLKRGSASGTTESSEVEGGAKKRRVDPSSKLIRVKIRENRPGMEDELKTVEDKMKFAARKGVEEMSKVAARLMKGICLGMEEEKVELKSRKAEFKKEVARLKSDLARERKRLNSMEATQEVEINELTKEAGKNLEEVVV
ncbi:hypothetical protein GIB67_032418 [Kingdonia uniflora]|uniref:Uncharacterized protein n=1 Tax=Kingdonia uniflora TaxID=39325 RepID=A0A7J7MIT8_9MAGN|nr:hypothetical protein GIB67_032418 [Kingdonia uniflora]